MKVFVYSKRSSKKIATITHVVNVEEYTDENTIRCITKSGEVFSFNTKEIKTTIYQN